MKKEGRVCSFMVHIYIVAQSVGGEGLKSCHETRAEEEIVCLSVLARSVAAC